MPWYKIDVRGEGNCFFHVVAGHVHNSWDGRAAMREVRKKLADVILTTVYNTTWDALDALVKTAEDATTLPMLETPGVATNDITGLYGMEKANLFSMGGGSNSPLWVFAYWLAFDELAIKSKPAEAARFASKDWKVLQFTLWGDDAFVPDLVHRAYNRRCHIHAQIPDEGWTPANESDILFLHTAQPPHYDGISKVRRIQPTMITNATRVTATASGSTGIFSPCKTKYEAKSKKGELDETIVDFDADELNASRRDDEDYDPHLTIDFLDVGMGDGTLIVCPDGSTILIDLGSTKNEKIAGRDAIRYVVDRLAQLQEDRTLDAPQIDHLFLTHHDRDHRNLIEELRARAAEQCGAPLKVVNIYIGGEPAPYQLNELFKETPPKTFASDYHAKEAFALDGESSVFGCILSVNCTEYKTAKWPNPNSIVLLLVYAGRVAIFMADAEEEVEAAIIEAYEEELQENPDLLKCDYLKIGHHGAEAGTSKDWLKVTRPRRAFVSADMQWSHPYMKPMKRVQKYAPLELDYKHSFLHGTGGIKGRLYEQVETDQAIYSTVDVMYPDPEQRDTSSETYVAAEGVQYQLVINADGAEQLFDTRSREGSIFLFEEPPQTEEENKKTDEEEQDTDV